MTLWRIARQRYADLPGAGAAKWGGRWNSPGRAVVYLSEHPALAMLETLVHLELALDELPEDYVLMRIRVPDHIHTKEIVRARFDLYPTVLGEGSARRKGDSWLQGPTTSGPILAVPSAVMPHCTNYLLNPAHADAGRVSIDEISPIPFDPRLLRFHA